MSFAESMPNPCRILDPSSQKAVLSKSFVHINAAAGLFRAK